MNELIKFTCEGVTHTIYDNEVLEFQLSASIYGVSVIIKGYNMSEERKVISDLSILKENMRFNNLPMFIQSTNNQTNIVVLTSLFTILGAQ